MATKFSTLVALAALLTGANASAASLALVTSTPQLAPGQAQLTVTIQGSGFAAGTSGGDVSISFSDTALQYVSGVAGSLFDTISIRGSSGPATLATPSPLAVDVFRFATGDVGTGGVLFDVATLVFNVLPGFGSSSTLQLGTAPPLVGWFDPSGLIPYTVTYGNLQVAAVPAPAAIWLLATAVGGLAARRFRQKAVA